MLLYLQKLQQVFEEHADAQEAAGMKAYMKNKFEFFGIKAPIRRHLSRPFLQKDLMPHRDELERYVRALWQLPQREYHYLAQEMVQCFHRKFTVRDITLFEYMITHNAWWDTVDFIATHLAGTYFRLFPGETEAVIQKWIESHNLWLQRTAILFQLKYKGATNTRLLAYIIRHLADSNEFFINKAIGWSLREYSKTNPAWVIDFVNQHRLSNLSRREALKVIEKKDSKLRE